MRKAETVGRSVEGSRGPASIGQGGPRRGSPSDARCVFGAAGRRRLLGTLVLYIWGCTPVLAPTGVTAPMGANVAIDADRTDATARAIDKVVAVDAQQPAVAGINERMRLSPGRSVVLGLSKGTVTHVVDMTLAAGEAASVTIGARSTVRGLLRSSVAAVVDDPATLDAVGSWAEAQPEFTVATRAFQALIAAHGALDMDAPEALPLREALDALEARLFVQPVGLLVPPSTQAAVESTVTRRKLIEVRREALPGSCTSVRFDFWNPNPSYTTIRVLGEGQQDLTTPRQLAPYYVVPEATVVDGAARVLAFLRGVLGVEGFPLGYASTSLVVDVPQGAASVTVYASDRTAVTVAKDLIAAAARSLSVRLSGVELDELASTLLAAADVGPIVEDFLAGRTSFGGVARQLWPVVSSLLAERVEGAIRGKLQTLSGAPLKGVAMSVGTVEAFFNLLDLSQRYQDDAMLVPLDTLFDARCRVSPVVSVTPSAGAKGTVFSQPGNGFTPYGAVTLVFRKPSGSQATLKVTADATGSYAHRYDSSLVDELGAFLYWASDDITGKASNVATFTITAAVAPQVWVSPSSGPKGTTFSQPGSGFTPGGSVTLTFQKPSGAKTTAKTTADGSGAYAWAYNSSQVDELGLFLYWATDDATGRASSAASFVITAVVAPQVWVSPSSGPKGTTFSQPGSGFTPGGSVTLTFQKPSGARTTVKTTADGTGAYAWAYNSSQVDELGLFLYWATDDTTGRTSPAASFVITL